MDELIYASATSLARAVRARQVSAQEVVDAHLARIDAVNPQINAVVQLTADTARKQARAADSALARGDDTGPLHGVPMTVKDSFDTAGVISTAGSPGRAAYLPAEDATAVARLRAAGAILLGKTNTPELTLAGETDNPIYGRTNNPYDLSRTPAGSSGGAAAIVAAGGSPLDVGSDIGGSIRVPAHCCGIAGIKPTSGRVPRTGHIPSFDLGALAAMMQVGPMARFVEDLMLALPIMSGEDWRDPDIVPMSLGDPRSVDLKSLRVAYYTDNGIVSPTPETATVVRSAARVLSDEGVSVVEDRPPEIEQSDDIWWQLYLGDGGAMVRKLLRQVGTDKSQSSLQDKLSLPALSTADYTELLARWDVFRSAMLSFMKAYDVILCPVSPSPAVPHGAVDRFTWSYITTFNLTGWPAAVGRGGVSSEGLPIGVQIVGRPWCEHVALVVAQHIEMALGGWQRPPL